MTSSSNSFGLNWHFGVSSEQVASDLARIINNEIQHDRKVLWLVAGGSNIWLAVKMRELINLNPPKSQLFVSLTDERFGELGHSDSNWQQLIDAGFNFSGVEFLPVLKGADFQTTVEQFKAGLAKALSIVDYRIGLFGMGQDGHTAGILPNYQQTAKNQLVASYEAADFRRISIGPAAIAQLDVAILVANGTAKLAKLRQMNVNLSAEEMPAQLLKTAGQLTVYTDCEGE